MKKKPGNPLIKRIPKELRSDWKKYLVVALFLILTIGFVSGMYVANGSMEQTAEESKEEYLLEDGHFLLEEEADEDLLTAIETGEMADIKAFYLEKAREELDEQFEEEFNEQFDEEFDKEFDEQFAGQIGNLLSGIGLSENAADEFQSAAFEEMKESSIYRNAYDSAYEEAYEEAYDEAYAEALEEMETEVEDAYAEAEETYELSDPEFSPVQVKLYENFYRNETEDHDNDGSADGTIRVYQKTEEINLACIMDGRLPVTDTEIAVDRMHADNAGIEVGDTITVSGIEYEVVGLLAYVNYSTLHEKNTDLMFDALQFDVAMVTTDGFERLPSQTVFDYAWRYQDTPADETEEKALSDDFLKALLTQTVVAENEIEDYLPLYANNAVHFATDDMGSDKAMGGVLLYILIVIIAFIFAITTTNTITRESAVVGTLRASGYTKRELVLHYLSLPVIVTLLAALIGNLLGYTVFKNVVISMYYNSYSLPEYRTVWNTEAFLRTTVVPIILMFAVNLVILIRMMQHGPLEFLRRDLKRNNKKRSIRLPFGSFMTRFRIRILFQNLPNYGILLVGILFVSVMMAMAVEMPATLDYYKEQVSDLMFADYQYILKDYKDEDGNVITTDTEDAEIFDMYSLYLKGDQLDEDVSVYGISTDSAYVEIDGLDNLKPGEVYITESFAEKYHLGIGDMIVLDEKYENVNYEWQVAGIYDGYLSIAVFMCREQYGEIFETKEDEFTGFFSDTVIDDLEENLIATVITEHDITKMADQLDHSMGAYMQYFQYLCVLLSAVLMYLLTKIIIEKNESAISMTKILGYTNGEIAKLYLVSTSLVVIVETAFCAGFGSLVMAEAWKIIMSSYNGWFGFHYEAVDVMRIFLAILAGYLIVLFFDFRRIGRVPMDEALKNAE